ncbi:MAG: hypothetical protein GX102_14020 [Porphyromonadaceae bacterium]|jgi:hypothetical protein|nr:hypothetical protein [Porphyromonadaceae bacterium]
MKRKYITPEIESIRLDKEISLQLASDPPSRESAAPHSMEPNLMSSPDSDPYIYENW